MYADWVETQKLLQRGLVEETHIGSSWSVQLNNRGRAVLGAATNPVKQQSFLFFFPIFTNSFPTSITCQSEQSDYSHGKVFLSKEALLSGSEIVPVDGRKRKVETLDGCPHQKSASETASSKIKELIILQYAAICTIYCIIPNNEHLKHIKHVHPLDIW